MLDKKLAVHIMRKSGYEKAARAVPGRDADFSRRSRVGKSLIEAVSTLLLLPVMGRAGVRYSRPLMRHNEDMELEKNTSSMPAPRKTDESCRTKFGVFPECPLCGGSLTPEHAHFKCFSCGWRDSCCD
jgi:hypothetical protein